MSEVLKKFGRYFLLDQVAQGGMAEIFRARLASPEGAGRLLVIKRIQAGFGENSEFQQMFKSEIKVTMGFNHPNIVQLYDFGDEQGQPYIAMEFVDGRNLRQFLTRCHELKQPFPIEIAAYIIEQAASGLHYAHCYKDKISGQPLDIVHRDISPQNILVSYDGNAKIIDFGIAKATTNSESTRAGVIKGKPSYLSPEQISGEVLDGRCDLFALGIVLWELLTGKKLFAGENDLAVLKLIESCNQHVKPPSTLNPKVPKELDYIVLKTLAKQREKRYQSGEELQRALHKFLYTFSPDFNPNDLSYFARDLFKNEIVEDRKKLQRLSEKAEQLLASDLPEAPITIEATTPVKREDTTTIVEKRSSVADGGGRTFESAINKQSKVEIDVASARSSGTARSRATASAISSNSRSTSSVRAAPPSRMSKEKGSGGKMVLVGLVALVGLVFFGPEFGIQIPVVSDFVAAYLGSGQETTLVLKGSGKGLTVAINGKTVGTSLPTEVKGVPAGTPLQITVTGNGLAFSQDVTFHKGEKKEVQVGNAPENLATAPAAGGPAPAGNTSPGEGLGGALNGAKMVSLRLNVLPGGGGATLTINGRSVDPNNPILSVPLDSPLELSAERPGFKPFKREFVLESRQLNGLKEWLMDVPMEPVRFGYLTLRTTPSADATIMIEGKPWVRKTPMENEKMPVGTYSIRLSNDVLGMEKTIAVTVQEGKAVNIDERLEIKR